MGILILFLSIIAISLLVFSGFVALITIIVKKIWLVRTGKKYNYQSYTTHNENMEKNNSKYDVDNPGGSPKWYPTGWVFNEETKMWDPPDYIHAEAKDKWEWDEEKAIWVDRDKKRRLERYQQFRKETGKGPTYEEWKAEREKQELDSTPKNTKTEQGTYRYDYIHVPNEEQQHYHHEDTTFKITQEFKQPIKQDQKEEPTPKKKKGYEEAYEARQILSYNESRNYKTLKEAADRKNYTVQIKMRLADIVKPRNGQYYDKYYEANFRRISQYHVDFTILNDRMKVVAIIELDDNSHDSPDRKERDEKIDSILKANGIKVIHTRHITSDILDFV